MCVYFADRKTIYKSDIHGDSTKVLPVIVRKYAKLSHQSQVKTTVTMSKDEADKYKTLVSNLENELKSKGESYNINVC